MFRHFSCFAIVNNRQMFEILKWDHKRLTTSMIKLLVFSVKPRPRVKQNCWWPWDTSDHQSRVINRNVALYFKYLARVAFSWQNGTDLSIFWNWKVEYFPFLTNWLVCQSADVPLNALGGIDRRVGEYRSLHNSSGCVDFGKEIARSLSCRL